MNIVSILVNIVSIRLNIVGSLVHIVGILVNIEGKLILGAFQLVFIYLFIVIFLIILRSVGLGFLCVSLFLEALDLLES